MTAKNKYSSLDVIRAYYMTEALKKELTTLNLTKAALTKKLEKVKKQADKLTPKQLFNDPLDNYHARYDNYVNSSWELKTISLADCGVWPAMGGLPKEMTYGSVTDTAQQLLPYLEDKTKLTVEVAKVLYIERLKEYAELITEYIPLVVMEGGVIRHMKLYKDESQKKFKKTKYDIDDGNHRAIAYALLGKKEIVALVGTRNYKNDLMY